MTKLQQEMVICQVCKEQKKMSEVLSAEIVREPIVEKILATHPDWSSMGFICIADLNRWAEYVKDVIKADKGELSALEEQVIKSLKRTPVKHQSSTTGAQHREIMADRLADFGGAGSLSASSAGYYQWIVMNSVVMLMTLTPTRIFFST
jgi:hypothetical protein